MGRYTVYAFQLVENAEMKTQALLPHERMFYVLNVVSDGFMEIYK